MDAQLRAVVAPIADLMRNFSLEATLPRPSELGELDGILPPGRPIYLSAPPATPHARLAEVAKHVRQAGFEPVPHIAARGFASREALDDFLARICGEAGARRALVIAGDVERPAGPFAGAYAIVASELLQQHGIQEIGISGYPDGHPKLSADVLDRALREKLAAARSAGLKTHIVSQFCFDADRISAWLRSLRAAGIDAPIRIGVAGPTSVKGLARYALRCGVRTSIKAMFTKSATQLLGDAAPDDLIGDLAAEKDVAELGPLSVHLYSFGGLVRTAQWASDQLPGSDR
ncbi:MAG: methylenetetrahydrofolate reductase [Xanthobacteraceae bacterium]